MPHHHTLAGRQRSLSWDPTAPLSNRRPQSEWSYEELDRFFGGSITEAASHLATNICNSYLDPSKANPLSPLPHSRRPQRLHTDTDPLFLDLDLKMVENRCSRCHRFKKDPPSPELGHDGSQAESKCKLEHHPFPCNFIETDDTVCEFHTNEHFEDTNATANAAKAADI